MSLENEQELSEIRKQAILSEKPLLRYYLNPSFNFDIDKWDKDATQAIVSMYKEIESINGPEWDKEMMQRMAAQWDDLTDGIHTHTKHNTKLLLGTHFMIGYEIGNQEDILLFAHEFKQRNNAVGLISPEILPSERIHFAEEFLLGVKLSGASLRTELCEEIHMKYHPRASSTDNWGPFRDVIDKLDLSGI